MPIYEYQCNNCNAKIERLQKMTDQSLLNCPDCQQPKLRRLISASGFILKGNGWYATDFKDKKSAPAKTTETKAATTTKVNNTTDTTTAS